MAPPRPLPPPPSSGLQRADAGLSSRNKAQTVLSSHPLLGGLPAEICRLCAFASLPLFRVRASSDAVSPAPRSSAAEPALRDGSAGGMAQPGHSAAGQHLRHGPGCRRAALPLLAPGCPEQQGVRAGGAHRGCSCASRCSHRTRGLLVGTASPGGSEVPGPQL